MPRTKSSKYCPRCERELPVSAFKRRRHGGYAPACMECAPPNGRITTIACEQCGNLIQDTPAKMKNRRFCSGRCANDAQRGEEGLTPANIERFWSMVDRSGGDDACWPYTGPRNRLGYGRFSIRQVRTLAHRIAAELTYGPCPDHLRACHHCDNPPCCNPKHLYYGTAKDNTQDMIKRGRAKFFDLRETRGERHWKSKLTADDVREIRRRAATGEKTRLIAADFGITMTHVRAVVRRLCWDHID